jgi:hypothetical protein
MGLPPERVAPRFLTLGPEDGEYQLRALRTIKGPSLSGNGEAELK